MSSPWYLLKCPSCRAQLRIKTEYTHMRGKCPVCKQWIESLVPKPLSFSDDAVVADEVWPEPPEILHNPSEGETASYELKPSSEPTKEQIKVEEEAAGVYNLAFDPDMPKTAGITRSAEWDQGSVPTSVAPPAALTPVVKEQSVASPLPKPSVPAAPVPVESYQTVIDPLFGDEVKVAIPASPVQQPATKTPAVPVAAPVAKLAEPQTVPVPAPQLEAPIPLPPKPPITTKKKKKKKVEEPAPAEDFSHLNKPTEDTHLYRLSEGEVNRIKPDSPPTLVFFDGVFGFPWTGNNLFPWIWLSLGFAFIFMLMALIMHIANGGSMYAQVGAAATGMAALMVYVFVLSYGCACWVNTINYTAAGSKAVEWYSEGWKDNIIHMLLMGYYFVLAMMMATPLLILNFVGVGWIFWLMGTLFIFPVFMFSGFASLTFWNFLHPEVIKKIIVKLPHYLTMYGLGLGLFAFAGVAGYFAVQYFMLAFIAGPIAAAVWLIYGRLLGRMAYLLQQEPVRKKKKKKKKKATTEEAGAEEAPVESASGAEPAVSSK